MDLVDVEELSVGVNVHLRGVPGAGPYLLYLLGIGDKQDAMVWFHLFDGGVHETDGHLIVDNLSFLESLNIEVRAGDNVTVLASGTFTNPEFHKATSGDVRVFDLRTAEQKEYSGNFNEVSVTFTVGAMKPFRRNMTQEGINIDLVKAAARGQLDMVMNRIWVGADADYARQEDGFTALCAAAENGHLAVIEYLLDGGASINALTNNGRTALAVAAAARQPHAVSLLLQRGANRRMTDEGGLTAEEIGSQDPEIAAIFESTTSKRGSKAKTAKSAAPAAAVTTTGITSGAHPAASSAGHVGASAYAQAITAAGRKRGAPGRYGTLADAVLTVSAGSDRRVSTGSVKSHESVRTQSSAGSTSSKSTRASQAHSQAGQERAQKLREDEEAEKFKTRHLVRKTKPQPAASAVPAKRAKSGPHAAAALAPAIVTAPVAATRARTSASVDAGASSNSAGASSSGATNAERAANETVRAQAIAQAKAASSAAGKRLKTDPLAAPAASTPAIPTAPAVATRSRASAPVDAGTSSNSAGASSSGATNAERATSRAASAQAGAQAKASSSAADKKAARGRGKV